MCYHQLHNELGKPYCFNCFYAFNSELGLLYFKSSTDTYHSGLIKQNPCIAGTILPDKLKTILVQGIQFDGELLPGDHPLSAHASANYHKKHPMALAMHGEIWTIQINHIKMTDSSKGFGKKLPGIGNNRLIAISIKLIYFGIPY